jgi:hypothetical protein
MSPQQRWAERNPLARWAHVALRSAIKRGLLNPQPCQVCGAEDVDGQHHDYNRPIDVVWLCRKHHKALHKRRAA